MALMSSDNPWALAFGILGNIISLVFYFAPLPTFYRIYKKKSTEGFQSLPYLVALFSAMLWLYYAMLKPNAFLILTINSFGCGIELIYTTIYIVYATKESRRLTVKLFVIMNLALFSSILVVIQFLVPASSRIVVLGWICVAFSIAVFIAPLTIMAQVIRTRSVQFMPFTLSFCLTLSAVLWFAYGFFQKDMCVAIPNVLGFIFGMVQMGLYARYRKVEKDDLKKNKVANDDNKNSVIVVMGTMGNSEVYPEEVDDDDDLKEAKNGKSDKPEDQLQQCPV